MISEIQTAYGSGSDSGTEASCFPAARQGGSFHGCLQGRWWVVEGVAERGQTPSSSCSISVLEASSSRCTVATTFRFFAGVAVRAIHHDILRQAGGAQGGFAGGHGRGVVVGFLAAAQHHMRIAVARGGENGGQAVFRHAQKVMRSHGRPHAVDGGVERAVGAVFEADGR